MKKPEPDSLFFVGADVDEIDSFFNKQPGPPPPIPSRTVLKPAGAQPRNAAVPEASPTGTQAKEPPQIPKKEEVIPAQHNEGPSIPAEKGHTEERLPSLLIDTSDFDLAPAPVKISIDAQLRKSGAEPLLNEFASLFSRLHPDCKGKALEFTGDSILLDSSKIGDISINSNGFQAKIWLHELGYGPSMLPTSLTSAIDREFRTFSGFIFTALKSSSYISLLAEKNGERTNLRICFHKSMDSPVSHSAPVRSRAT